MSPKNIDDGYDGSDEWGEDNEDGLELPEGLSRGSEMTEHKTHIPPVLYTLAQHDHTQGFGSFDFTQAEHFEAFKLSKPRSVGAYLSRPNLVGPEESNYSNRYLMTVEYQKLLAKKNRNQITEPFPLLELPLEIRNRIYTFLLLPIQRPDDQVFEPSMVPQGIRFYLSVSELDLGNDREEVNQKRFIIPKSIYSDKESDTRHDVVSEIDTDSGVRNDFDWDESDFGDSGISEENESEVDSDTDNWSESFGYKLEIRCRRVCIGGERTMACPRHPFAVKGSSHLFPCDCTLQEFADYAFIRGLSHVSHQISREVGTVIWQNAVLEVDELYALPAFVRHHPAALPLIRGLVLPLRYMKWHTDTPTEDLSAACEFIRRYLTLSFLSVNFQSMPDLLSEVLKGRRKRKWTPMLRKLKLSYEFHIIVALSGRGNMKPPKGSVRRLRALWLPECLAGGTELEEYCDLWDRNNTAKERKRFHIYEMYGTRKTEDSYQLRVVESNKLGLQQSSPKSRRHLEVDENVLQMENTEKEVLESQDYK
ncbi:hypothetical protein HYFRA_00002444 [Hymenoscyphus fraxineus]|uniref:Uncharacterized protein n=1 Tax=Hymenoscyphus fraxineus TaxID=746836 RepID=A0A9N9Q0M6_9HELO|nr:hypothetical protein HYFRA_00002444 [Hymenoscyphus fraxineus]